MHLKVFNSSVDFFCCVSYAKKRYLVETAREYSGSRIMYLFDAIVVNTCDKKHDYELYLVEDNYGITSPLRLKFAKFAYYRSKVLIYIILCLALLDLLFDLYINLVECIVG